MAMSRFQIRSKGRREIGSRSSQQDAFLDSSEKLYRERGLLVVLSDGMGGMQGGERFSAIATEEMQRHFAQMKPTDDICDDLLGCYSAARAKALDVVKRENLDGGATVVAVLLRNGRCAFLSVGDSRIYLVRKGELIQLNREQSLGVLLDESAAFGFIPAEEAKYNLRRAALFNNLCEPSSKSCDRNTAPFALRRGDKLVLMSDGVFGTLSDRELQRLLSKPKSLDVDAIIEAVQAKALPRQDNMSVYELVIT